jgi:hypothetical protein
LSWLVYEYELALRRENMLDFDGMINLKNIAR